MPSITCWTRLEPRTQRNDMADSLAARLHDPLWQLARQWQIGEFTAEDTGSPVHARVRIEQSPLTRLHAGPFAAGVAGRPYDARTAPLELAVEGEPVVPNSRLAVVAGLQFVEQLARHGVGAHGPAYATRYALALPSDGPRLDAAARRFLAVVGGRAIDGVRLHADLRPALAGAGGSLPPEPAIPAADRAAITEAARAFVAWYDAESGRALSGAAWQRDRFEHAFAVAGPTPTAETVLVAAEYADGRLDWPAFDRQPGATLGAAADRARARTVTRTIIPTPVTYRGMPASRWWEFEDAEVDFGQVEAGPTDLLRLLLVSFAVDYGNDWFVVPVELDVGAVHRVRSLVMTDSFGQRTLVRPAAQVDGTRRDWRMFSPAASVGASFTGAAGDDSAELMVLVPATATNIQGEPIEEVVLARDELANLAWAVERVVESAAGGRLDRVAAARRDAIVADGDGDGGLRYRLSTTVPDNWLPLVPVRIDPTKPDVRLRRGRVLLDRDGQPKTPAALGRLLDPGAPLDVYEEEVPRAGRRVTRAHQYTRWVDGSTHAWIGRRTSTGAGEAWSGLRFDTLEPPPDR